MKTAWYIAKKDLLETLKDRNSFILLLAVPLVLIAVIGLAFGNIFGSGSSQISITVAVSNQDNGYVGTSIINALKINTNQLQITVNQYNSPGQVTDQVANNSNVNAGVVIPAGTTDKVNAASQNGTPPKNLIQFYSLPSNNDPRATIVQNILTNVLTSELAGSSAVGQVYSVCNQPGNHCAPATINPQAIASNVGQVSVSGGQAAVQALTAGKAVKINSFDQLVPGYAVFFALFGINAAAATILQEKEDGTFRRLLIAPIQKYALLGGKLLAQFLLTLAQLVVLFAVGYFAFHMDVGSWPAAILLLICTSFATTGLGILLVSVVKTRRQLNPIVTLVVLITSAIGGAWWPLFLEPSWMQQFAKLGVTAWAMEGLNGVMILGKDFAQVAPDMLGLLAYGIICFLIAMRFFRFQEKAA
ncbi:MAG TPA: ABC transporter permease [Ktedonobacteraceae bacterium]|jgi:ABC-2 type transport system permease protein|nr:ABC transporter permease [Ktedonobacteraceae bacterium]